MLPVSEGSITKVEFYEGTTKLGEDLTSPYTFAWNNVPAGNYTITATGTASDGATASATVDVSVTSGAGCTASGVISHEMWTGISGTTVSSIPVNDPPTTSGELTIFEIPAHTADNYGTRIRGYICPPVSGNYTFWIAGDDHAELWLSTDDNPANKRKIASEYGWTSVRQWTKYASQQSAPVSLAANKRYYIEALHKEATGGDHVAVGWQLPDGTLERPIPGMRLSPIESQATMMAAFEDATMQSTSRSSLMVEETSTEMDVYPNPVESGQSELMIIASEHSDTRLETTVEIQRMTGEVVFSDRFSCDSDCDGFSIPAGKSLTPGVYLVNFITNGKRSSRRLLVK
jgi:hypothetical protein